MPSVTIKDIPDDLLERLRQQAPKDKRSMNKEVIYLMDVRFPILQSKIIHLVQPSVAVNHLQCAIPINPIRAE